MKKLKISIITACYNSESTIEACMKSVKDQHYKNTEHIIVDGKSCDTTLQIINKNKTSDTVLISEPDTGIYNALNKGILRATGDVIGFLHSDDTFATETALARVADNFDSLPCDAVYGDLNYVSSKDREKVVRRWRSGDLRISQFKLGWMPPHPAIFIRRDIYNQLGLFKEEYRISGDYELILRFFYKNEVRAVYLPDLLVRMELGGVSNKSIQNLLAKTREDIKAMKEHGINPVIGIIGKNLGKVKQFL